MSDLDIVRLLRELPPDTDVERAANIIDAIRGSSAAPEPDTEETVGQQPARSLTPAQADEAERQALGKQMLEKLRADCPGSFS